MLKNYYVYMMYQYVDSKNSDIILINIKYTITYYKIN